MITALIILSYSFFVNLNGGILFPFGDLAGGKKNSASFSLSLGVAEFDQFSAGANFSFSPSISLLFPSAYVSARFDRTDFFANIGIGIGPGILSREKKIFTLFGLSAFTDFGIWIETRRFAAHISPGVSAFLGNQGGYSFSVLVGFSIFSY
jgi:hypothetical protein